MIELEIASNALGIVAGVMWLLCGLYILTCARKREVSLRAVIAAGLIAAGGWSIAKALHREIPLDAGAGLVTLALLTLFAVGTHYGRQIVGMSGWGLTEPDQFRDTAHIDLGAPELDLERTQPISRQQ